MLSTNSVLKLHAKQNCQIVEIPKGHRLNSVINRYHVDISLVPYHGRRQIQLASKRLMESTVKVDFTQKILPDLHMFERNSHGVFWYPHALKIQFAVYAKLLVLCTCQSLQIHFNLQKFFSIVVSFRSCLILHKILTDNLQSALVPSNKFSCTDFTTSMKPLTY